MRLSKLLQMTTIAGVLGVGVCSLPMVAAAQDQSSGSSDDLAAAAKKAREQKANAPKPKKVLTNDDIPEAKTEAPAATASGKPGEAAKADASSGDDAKTEEAWKKRFAAQKDKISSAERELDVMQRELQKEQVQYYNDPQKAMQQQYDRSDIKEKNAKIDEKKKEIEALKQQMTDMEDEMRKAGGDPGWAR